MLTIKPISAFSDNYIWLFHEANSDQAWVVDPGDATPVLQYLEQHQLSLAGVLITHHHFDHTGGLEQLLLTNKSLPVIGPNNAAIAQITHRVGEGDSVEAAGTSFEVLEIPGHTLDHIAFFANTVEPNPLLFCGDTLFAGGCGRVFEGTMQQMHGSLAKLASLPANSQIFAAHEYTRANLDFAAAVEPDSEALQQRCAEVLQMRNQDRPTLPSNMALELATNPFLRSEQPGVMAAASQRASQNNEPAPTTAVDVFSLIRQWKDNF